VNRHENRGVCLVYVDGTNLDMPMSDTMMAVFEHPNDRPMEDWENGMGAGCARCD
jgi:hypothetical protein